MFSATLSIVAAICTILGFVIGPGMTHVRPWLMEKFSSDKQEATKNMLAKDYNNMSRGELLLEKIQFDYDHKFDYRKKIRDRRKELNSKLRGIHIG